MELNAFCFKEINKENFPIKDSYWTKAFQNEIAIFADCANLTLINSQFSAV